MTYPVFRRGRTPDILMLPDSWEELLGPHNRVKLEQIQAYLLDNLYPRYQNSHHGGKRRAPNIGFFTEEDLGSRIRHMLPANFWNVTRYLPANLDREQRDFVRSFSGDSLFELVVLGDDLLESQRPNFDAGRLCRYIMDSEMVITTRRGAPFLFNRCELFESESSIVRQPHKGLGILPGTYRELNHNKQVGIYEESKRRFLDFQRGPWVFKGSELTNMLDDHSGQTLGEICESDWYLRGCRDGFPEFPTTFLCPKDWWECWDVKSILADEPTDELTELLGFRKSVGILDVDNPYDPSRSQKIAERFSSNQYEVEILGRNSMSLSLNVLVFGGDRKQEVPASYQRWLAALVERNPGLVLIGWGEVGDILLHKSTMRDDPSRREELGWGVVPLTVEKVSSRIRGREPLPCLFSTPDGTDVWKRGEGCEFMRITSTHINGFTPHFADRIQPSIPESSTLASPYLGP